MPEVKPQPEAIDYDREIAELTAKKEEKRRLEAQKRWDGPATYRDLESNSRQIIEHVRVLSTQFNNSQVSKEEVMRHLTQCVREAVDNMRTPWHVKVMLFLTLINCVTLIAALTR